MSERIDFAVGGAVYRDWRSSGSCHLPAGFRFGHALPEKDTEFVVVHEATGEPIEPGTSGVVTVPFEGVYVLWARGRQ